MIGREPTSASKKGARPPRVERANLQAGFLVRMVVLACTAVVGSAWGLAHFYTHMKEPMTVPLARDAGGGEAWDAGAGTVEIELEGR